MNHRRDICLNLWQTKFRANTDAYEWFEVRVIILKSTDDPDSRDICNQIAEADNQMNERNVRGNFDKSRCIDIT
jgi:hypothetical protein